MSLMRVRRWRLRRVWVSPTPFQTYCLPPLLPTSLSAFYAPFSFLFIPQILLLMLLSLRKKVLGWLLPELSGSVHEYSLLTFQA